MKTLSAILVIAVLAVGYRLRTTEAKDGTQKYSQAAAKLQHANAVCEERTTAVDKLSIANDIKYAHLFGTPDPKLLASEAQATMSTHGVRVRECAWHEVAGREQWKLQ